MDNKKLKTKLNKASREAGKSNYIKSILLCKSILKKEANTPAAYKLLATNLIALKRYKEAEVVLKKVLVLVSEEEGYKLQHLLGCNYLSQGNPKKALEILELLFNQTGESNVLLDIALAYFNLSEYENARDVYLKLIELEPDNHQAKFNLYPILLHFKDYKGAWTCFHSRLQRQEIIDQVHWFAPQWNGESLIGKNILIYPEQGIGDNLAYTACFAEAIADAAKTYIVCDNRLKGLYKSNFSTATILSYDDVNAQQSINANIDVQILAGSLSYLYRDSAESYQKQKPLIIAADLRTETAKLLGNKKLRIGISWFHGRVNDGNSYSIQLETLLPMLQIEGIEWVNLQFGEYSKELKDIQEKHGVEITDLDSCSAAGDFEQYGSLISNVDLVISASNAALMLASRLGVKTWMFLPGKQQGIKRQSNQDSITIKNTRVFYKEGAANWDNVVQQFCSEIKRFAELST
jgi:tetratricopeptide (TPR) repeat protein